MALRKTGDTRTKTQKQDKSQGEPARTNSASDARVRRPPRTMNRGIGSSYAYAVRNVMEEAKTMKGSDAAWLGQEKKILDPKEYSHSLIETKK